MSEPNVTRRTEEKDSPRLDPTVGRWASLLATLLLMQVAATTADAQEATSDNPGVIDTDGDDQQEAQQGDQGNQGDSGGQQGSAPEDQGQVITPDNANPNEQYNLPPNFNPNYRPKQTPQNVKVTIDFRQAKLEEVVKFFSGAMNKNFIIANSIQANKTITIISPEEVTLGEAYRAFMAALEMNGLTVVRMGSFLKIVQAKQAISEPGPTYDAKDNLPNEARMVTAIVPVKNADVDRIKEIIGNFTSPAATVITYQTNLIVSENASNLRRIRRLVERLDKGDAGEQVFVYKVQYADATKVSEKLKEIFNEGQNQGNRRRQKNQGQGEQADFDVDVSQLIADERTNQLIIVSNKSSFEKIKDMISLLDVPTEAGGGQVHVKFLEYANAEELSSTLSNLVSAAQRSNQRNRGGGRGGDGGGGQQVGTILQGEVQITSYKPNNALVITASPKDFVALEEVINKLDRPRRQVYVEAVVMEIGIDTNRTVGLGYNLGLGQDFKGVIPDSAVESGTVDDTEGLAVGQSNFPGITGLGSALQGTGGAIGLLGPLVEIPGTNISLPAFAMLLQATQTDNSVNILSTPSILTMDNEEAEIVVGERVPFLRGVAGGGGGLGGLGSLAAGSALGQSGQQTGQTGAQSGLGGLGGLGGLTGGLGGLVSPIDYQDVGLTLRIKPQVNDSRYVRLEVDQEVSDIKGAGGSELTPTQTRRNAKTVVLVKDQSTVVIGGLMRDVENKTVEKVPFLGDIPLVGKLFRKTSTITTKQNLVLMLTPYIIEGEADLQKIYERKIKERKELLKLFGKRDIEYIKSINFQKKSGLLDRMRRNISGAVEMKEAREKAQESFEREGPRYRILGQEREQESQQPKESGESNESTESGESAPSEESGESGTSDETSKSDSNGDQE
jgi:general secretion pathway protein D